jgi:superfamily II DNA or RNA helicase
LRQNILLRGHFSAPVTVEGVRPLGDGYELQVRRHDGMLDETIISADELQALLEGLEAQPASVTPVDGHQLRLLVESARIRLAYAYDKQFAVSLSGIRTLPHQIEAVYERMLPQPRLRFLIADDPGAGKTIMAGLYIKEMKLRQAVERILILTPAPLTIQWQEELLRFFNEPFQIIHSGNDQQQLLNLWQRESQVICSVDYAKQPEVRERVWQQRYDLVIIDEAHKCSAFTKRYSGRPDDVEKTRRYQLAEKVTAPADHVLLLTATPHHGDDDRFGHFLRLIDPDVFPEPHRYGERAREVRRGVLGMGGASPWAIRRLKEDLRDVDGRRLFPDRHAQTVAFELKREEYSLYKAVTSFINEFLPQADGRRRQSVALTRTVLQRRLASSANAIYESLRRRLERQSRLLEELEAMPASQRARHLERLRGRLTDIERDEDDLDDQEREDLIDSFTAAEQLEQIRAEVAALKELVEQAGRVRQRSPDSDSKLQALRACLTGSQFDELKDGRGKLLIFTEHRDTLTYLRQHLTQWGFSTCEIHGGMNPHERRQAQDLFRTQAQVCVATEAAGEGINLQFCHLMINYDLPWNPTRLEQRMGRIHRIGQERDVYVYNFVAEQSEDGQPIVEGSILRRLLLKLDQMRDALGPNRVYDVIGEVLALNAINLPEMLREAAYDPRRLDEYLDQIDRIDPGQLRRYEEATGIALAQSNVDFSAFQQHNYEVEERRLMPEYVARQFLAAAEQVHLSVEPRADGLWRIDYVPAGLRSERLAAVRRQGPPEESYRKITFYKEHLGQNRHLDAVLVGPGHALYAAVDEALNERLAGLREGVALFVDTHTAQPYRLHFLEMAIRGEERSGEGPVTLHAEVVAVVEALSGDPSDRFSLAWPDILHDLAPLDAGPEQVRESGHARTPELVRDFSVLGRIPELVRDVQPAIDFVRAGAQIQARRRVQAEREHYAEIVRDYLTRSFEARIRATENRVMSLRGRELAGDSDVALARQRAEQDLADLQRTRAERLRGLDRLAITRPGPVRHLASALVLPPDTTLADALALEEIDEDARRASEMAAMQVVMQHERQRGWEPFDVSNLHDGCGFDIRSLGPADPATGQRPVRRIEVKGRQRGQPVRLSINEWLKARQLGESYWLYVVWDPRTTNRELVSIQDPGNRLEHLAREVQSISHFELSAEAIAAGSWA